MPTILPLVVERNRNRLGGKRDEDSCVGLARAIQEAATLLAWVKSLKIAMHREFRCLVRTFWQTSSLAPWVGHPGGILRCCARGPELSAA